MNTEFIILAQGTQQRLGNHLPPKQLLPLPFCGQIPILCRTVRQVFQISGGWCPTIGTWPGMKAALSWGNAIEWVNPAYITLPDPGNSSLKGIARYIEQ